MWIYYYYSLNFSYSLPNAAPSCAWRHFWAHQSASIPHWIYSHQVCITPIWNQLRIAFYRDAERLHQRRNLLFIRDSNSASKAHCISSTNHSTFKKANKRTFSITKITNFPLFQSSIHFPDLLLLLRWWSLCNRTLPAIFTLVSFCVNSTIYLLLQGFQHNFPTPHGAISCLFSLNIFSLSTHNRWSFSFSFPRYPLLSHQLPLFLCILFLSNLS